MIRGEHRKTGVLTAGVGLYTGGKNFENWLKDDVEGEGR